jgi:hypothetical protein
VRPDFSVSFDGSFYCVEPLNAATKEWLLEQTVGEISWLGNTLCVNHHYIDAMFKGMIEERLVPA